MDLRKLKLLNSKTCCGYEFTAQDITSLIKNNDHKFYGGRVEYYSVTKCPKCGKEVVILLEGYANTYRVIDIAVEDVYRPVESKVEKVDIAIDEPKEEIKQDKIKCPKCNKEFKTKAGLTKHIKSCK